MRFVKGGAGSVRRERGGEVVDLSANPYLASAAILGLAIDGMKTKAVLLSETTVDPDTAVRLIGS